MTNEQDNIMDDDDFLALTLSPPVSRPQPPSPSPQPQPQPETFNSMQARLFSQNPQLQLFNYPLTLSGQNPSHTPANSSPPPMPPVRDQPPARQPARQARTRRNQAQPLRQGKSETVPVLFPWATTHRATVHSLKYLMSMDIVTITGKVQCRRCEREFEVGYNLPEEFRKLWTFIKDTKEAMKDRAPKEWESPEFLDCKFCKEKGCVKPIVANKKRAINWLFLLLGKFLGCLTLEQLKYFCKHSRNHRTGAKNRVLYLTYLGLCKQLDPSGPFEALDL
ncbi:hypothetical protein TIFTF001_030177 [Ficus carica]|uniref:DUF7086 domain-containing protein n=1 Tax=Ficus carica TaxID=3494 RepID=A0AA88DTC7_FICCA|nr:hypothetical protein TIFTF001_030177 [Ficus carica]